MNSLDITKRLQRHAGQCSPVSDQFGFRCVRCEAADEIERLRAEVARLNTFLHPIGVVINREVRGD